MNERAPAHVDELPAGLPPACGAPRVRQTSRWMARPLSFLRGLQKEHGDLFTLHLLQEDPWVMVGDPALVERIFRAPTDVLHAGEPKRLLEPILGPRSVLLLDEAPHMRQRRLLLPPFHGDRMARYAGAMRAAAEAELERWPTGVAAPSAPHMGTITLEVILRAVFGVSEREQLDPLRETLRGLLDFVAGDARTVLVALAEPQRLEGERLAGLRAILARTDELVLAEIARRRAQPDLGEREDIMSLLLAARHEDGSPMSDGELRDELLTLLVAGHETTATSLAWALERLVRSPGAMERTVAEAEAGGGPYTDAVIQETLRLRPVFPMVARAVKKPFELGDYTLPAGVTVMPAIALVHRRPDVYLDPDDFRPERFLETPPGTYTWIPFGGGVRRCLGASFALLEMRIVLSTLLARVEILADEPEPETAKRRVIALPPSRGGRVVLQRRSRGSG
jgi:cytochrome P450 family 135